MQMRIGGKEISSADERWIPVINPATGDEIDRVPEGTLYEVEDAVSSALSTFDGWAKKTARERGTILYRAAGMVRAQHQELAKKFVKYVLDAKRFTEYVKASNGRWFPSFKDVAADPFFHNPKDPHIPINDILSLTVIGPDIYHADCYATAAFAMGSEGIYFIEDMPRVEGYMIDRDGRATFTTDFNKYVISNELH